MSCLASLVLDVADTSVRGLNGRIVSVHADWNFVVIDLGWDNVQIGDQVSIVRNGEVLAEAQIARVQEAVSAATVMPAWSAEAIQVNDQVDLL